MERLESVLYIGRPVHGQAESTTGLFKVVDSGKGAQRVPVKLGRSSVNVVEVVEGLHAGSRSSSPTWLRGTDVIGCDWNEKCQPDCPLVSCYVRHS